jgi:hypothetical protein
LQKFWVQPNQGGAIGLAFKLVNGFFLIVRVFEVVVERGDVRTYARTLNVTNGSDERTQTQQSSKQLFKMNFDLSEFGMVA